MNDERFRKTKLAVGLGLAGNIALACLKGIVGFTAQSSALLADAARSTSDAVRSIAIFMNIQTQAMLPEEAFSKREGKKMPVSTILLSLIMLLLGVEMGISAMKSLWAGVDHAPRLYAFAAIAVSLAVKEAIYQYTYKLGKHFHDQEIITNARGHRFDIYSSIVALIGMAAAQMGHLRGLSFLYYMDPLAALVVSVLVLRSGIKFIKDTLHINKEHILQHEDAADLIAAVQVMKGVITVDDLKAREQGHYVVVDIKISVNPRASVWEGHELSKKVKQQLMKRFHHVSDVYVHVAPYDAGFPYKHDVDTEQQDFPSVIH
ncbi:cation diffusion facilitator family transporter [Paenibacillus alba]|uniref:Cation diffusion facilitator family transporter n=1 Tax=Paenibacillus alba TaxID=1197127 RepID=A0ABU6FYI0_9BACL|nr:cation diffusion facilitator family transporter [Paenibacillus alba]MEC0225609.1 cation diffusion facilitator family transporter [Paenibacillus alba]